MMRAVAAMGLTLAACDDGGLADQIARDQAKKSVNPILAQRFPGVPLEPASNCVIDNARAGELLQLAGAGTRGVTPVDTELVVEIVTRPETVQCLIEDGLAPFLT
ncbi:MAG: succinate dehydrogenase [Pseudomonadota bacterium]